MATAALTDAVRLAIILIVVVACTIALLCTGAQPVEPDGSQTVPMKAVLDRDLALAWTARLLV